MPNSKSLHSPPPLSSRLGLLKPISFPAAPDNSVSISDSLSVPSASSVFVNMRDSGTEASKLVSATIVDSAKGEQTLQFDRNFLFPIGTLFLIKTASGGDCRGEVIQSATGTAKVRVETIAGICDSTVGNRVEVGVISRR